MGRRVWRKEALDRPETSSASDLLCEFKSLLFSSLGLNCPIWEVGEVVFLNCVARALLASESLKECAYSHFLPWVS